MELCSTLLVPLFFHIRVLSPRNFLLPLMCVPERRKRGLLFFFFFRFPSASTPQGSSFSSAVPMLRFFWQRWWCLFLCFRFLLIITKSLTIFTVNCFFYDFCSLKQKVLNRGDGRLRRCLNPFDILLLAVGRSLTLRAFFPFPSHRLPSDHGVKAGVRSRRFGPKVTFPLHHVFGENRPFSL